MATKTIEIETHARIEAIDITPKVKSAIREMGCEVGVCVVYVPHTTAGVFINEHADPDVARDILEKLDKLAPRNAYYHHSEGNADSHIKSTLVGSSVVIPVEAHSLLLGTWQGIFFAEFDGPRKRRVIVSCV